QAGEVRHPTPHQRLAKGDVGEDTVQGIVVVMIGRSGEQCPRRLGPVIRRSYCKLVLALEVVEEGPFADARRGTELLDRSRRVALGANDRQRSVEQLGPRVLLGIGFGHAGPIPTGWSAVKAADEGPMPVSAMRRSGCPPCLAPQLRTADCGLRTAAIAIALSLDGDCCSA